MSAESQSQGQAPGGAPGAGVPGLSGGGGMAAITAITQRELASLFYQPIAYVVGAIFLALVGHFFVTETLVPGQEASLRTLFERMAGVLVFALPLLTMRSIADDFASGTIETLMTAPVSETSVVVGKFLGALAFYVALLATTVLHVLLLASQKPVGTVILVGYLGMILLGGLFIAVGIFASSCTRHQLLAAILSVSILAVFTFVVDYLVEYAPWVWLRQACAGMNVLWHYADFGKGIIDTKSVLFFLSGIVFFLFLATKVMESRRWR
ncbi:MAG: ABC transporter permease subunit [Phycisphaerae bacterium]|nr:ABC transporter permease subunit [Phycisphaerae bacterium]